MSGPFFIGVDVGTTSARAGLFDAAGRLLFSAAQPIKICEPENEFYEQSSDDIWDACCKVVRCVSDNVDASHVKGIGFDATCSLVALDTNFRPLTVSPSGEHRWNVIMWMDHRASEQAQRISHTAHRVLAYVGNTMSLEMQTPKLLWLKENLKEENWDKVGHFLDLPDFLTWKATGNLNRSLCSLVCKWTYQADNEDASYWDDSYFQKIGLEDLVMQNYAKIGTEVHAPGMPCGEGLSQRAALELGLQAGTAIGTSIIDAHAGGLGSLGCNTKENYEINGIPLTQRLALISGTSTCHMAVSEKAVFVPGVWGPYFSAMVPGFWLNEGGQSASGKLIDHIVTTHPAYPWIQDEAKQSGKHEHEILNNILADLAKKTDVPSLAFLTKNLHMWPDYHGNRSPLADTSLKGMISGLSLASGAEELACLYLATVQALAYGTKHIIEEMNKSGHAIHLLTACGGLAKNPLYIQTHADVLGLPIVLPHEAESVLLGAAILGACASKFFSDIQGAMSTMCGSGEVVLPNKQDIRYHEKKYAVFHKMVEHQKLYQQIMKDM